jgi:hypothetical protein
MLALEMLLKEVFFHVARRVVLEDDGSMLLGRGWCMMMIDGFYGATNPLR